MAGMVSPASNTVPPGIPASGRAKQNVRAHQRNLEDNAFLAKAC